MTPWTNAEGAARPDEDEEEEEIDTPVSFWVSQPGKQDSDERPAVASVGAVAAEADSARDPADGLALNALPDDFPVATKEDSPLWYLRPLPDACGLGQLRGGEPGSAPGAADDSG